MSRLTTSITVTRRKVVERQIIPGQQGEHLPLHL